jgi:hypothetical protein
MLPFLLTLGSAALLLSGVGGNPGRSAAAPCSLAPFPDTRSPEVTYLLGRAQPDTVFAGKGEVQPSARTGQSGPGTPRAVYGQRVQVDRFGGADSVSLAQAFRRNGTRVVLIVPWGYDTACETTYWRGSARWIRLREPGVFILLLRPEAQWAKGIPTFDALMADLEPYPHGRFYRREERGTEALKTMPSLTAAEYLELYRALPERETVRTNPAAARQALDWWEQRHPELAKKYPATKILEDVRRNLKDSH